MAWGAFSSTLLPSIILRCPLQFAHFRASCEMSLAVSSELGDVPYGLLISERNYEMSLAVSTLPSVIERNLAMSLAVSSLPSQTPPPRTPLPA